MKKQMEKELKTYGKELILDLHDCDPTTFTRESIEEYCIRLCRLIKMKREDFYIWDDRDITPEDRQTKEKTTGTSAIQFILTSNITIHALDLLKNVYLNIFSCEDFNEKDALNFSKNWFKGKVVNSTTMERI